MAEAIESVVTEECLRELIDFFATRGTPYRARHVDKRYEVVEKMCLHLFARDYYIQTIDNSDGKLCAHYPSHLILLERSSSIRDKRKNVNNCQKLNELFKAAKSARCFCRFPIPVILMDKKNICRCSTLATAAELYGRNGMEWLFSGHKNSTTDEEELPRQQERKPSEWSLVDQVREYDSQLINTLGITLICDLMVEMRKSAYGITVTSSEKADGNLWYSGFHVASIPYPGCEFFIEYKDHNQEANGLHYDWSKPLNDAILSVPSPLPESVGISFENYQSWDVIKLTQNYLKLLLHYLEYEEGGVLIHCVAGWDRTPMFISLLRISLWADGLAHESLSAPEILYLTLAYDWFIFGHKFEERLKKGEEVLYFCFDFLQYITSEEYSIKTILPETSMTKSNTSVIEHEDLEERPHPIVETHEESTSHVDPLNSLETKISLNVKTGDCLYQPSVLHNNHLTGHHMDTRVYQGSLRTRKLLIVRELFSSAYKAAIPTSGGGGGGGGGGVFEGLWSRVTGNRTT